MPARTPRDRAIGLGVAILILLALGWAATRQADDSTSRTEATMAALRRSGIDTPRADITGLGATVYGLADSETEREQALQAVRRVDGVRDVIDRLTVEARPTSAPKRTRGDPNMAPKLEDGPRLAAGTAPASPTKKTPAPSASKSTAASRSTPASRSSRSSRSVPAVQIPADASCEVAPAVLKGARVSFADGTATVETAGKTTLHSVARHMLRCPQTVLRINGRATQAASPADNLQLSRLRSQAVSNHLDMQGVPVSRLVATYRGDRAPAGDHADLTMHAEVPR